LAALTPPPAAGSELAVTEVSYSALEEYRRCAYRFYVQRTLGLPAVEDDGDQPPGAGGSGLSARERGVLVHSLLERLDFRRPVIGDPATLGHTLTADEANEVVALVTAFKASDLCARLGRATT